MAELVVLLRQVARVHLEEKVVALDRITGALQETHPTGGLPNQVKD